jgi:arginase
MVRNLTMLGAPSSAGAYAPGQEKAPAAFRRHGLAAALEHAGWHVDDLGDVETIRWRPDPSNLKAMNLDAVRRTALAVSKRLAPAFGRGGRILVLGGDCTVELGTLAAALQHSDSVGLIYIDLDADLNTPETSDGALDWTGVAHLLCIPGTAKALTGLGPREPMLAPQDVLLFAVNEITDPEHATIDRLNIQQIPLAEVKRDPVAGARRAIQWGQRFEHLLVHLDADVLCYTDFPIAENVRRAPGLSFDELARVLTTLPQAPNLSAVTLTEINPDHAPDEGEAFCRLIGLLGRAFTPTRSPIAVA